MSPWLRRSGTRSFGGRFPPIRLAALQRARGRGAVRDHGPDDPVEMRDLGTGGEARRAARVGHVACELLIDDARASHALGGDELEGAGADHLGDLRERVGPRQALGHDRRHVAAGLAERVRQQREGPLEAEDQRLVAVGGKLVGRREERLAEGVALAPAVQGGNAVAGEHGLAVVELEAVAERDAPGLALVRGGGSLRHLRLGLYWASVPKRVSKTR